MLYIIIGIYACIGTALGTLVTVMNKIFQYNNDDTFTHIFAFLLCFLFWPIILIWYAIDCIKDK